MLPTEASRRSTRAATGAERLIQSGAMASALGAALHDLYGKLKPRVEVLGSASMEVVDESEMNDISFSANRAMGLALGNDRLTEDAIRTMRMITNGRRALSEAKVARLLEDHPEVAEPPPGALRGAEFTETGIDQAFHSLADVLCAASEAPDTEQKAWEPVIKLFWRCILVRCAYLSLYRGFPEDSVAGSFHGYVARTDQCLRNAIATLKAGDASNVNADAAGLSWVKRRHLLVYQAIRCHAAVRRFDPEAIEPQQEVDKKSDPEEIGPKLDHEAMASQLQTVVAAISEGNGTRAKAEPGPDALETEAKGPKRRMAIGSDGSPDRRNQDSGPMQYPDWAIESKDDEDIRIIHLLADNITKTADRRARLKALDMVLETARPAAEPATASLSRSIAWYRLFRRAWSMDRKRGRPLSEGRLKRFVSPGDLNDRVYSGGFIQTTREAFQTNTPFVFLSANATGGRMPWFEVISKEEIPCRIVVPFDAIQEYAYRFHLGQDFAEYRTWAIKEIKLLQERGLDRSPLSVAQAALVVECLRQTNGFIPAELQTQSWIDMGYILQKASGDANFAVSLFRILEACCEVRTLTEPICQICGFEISGIKVPWFPAWLVQNQDWLQRQGVDLNDLAFTAFCASMFHGRQEEQEEEFGNTEADFTVVADEAII